MVMLITIAGCEGDDSSTKSSNRSDAEFFAFISENARIDEYTVDLLSSMFRYVATIIDSTAEETSSRDNLTGTATDETAIVYHESSQFWYCSVSYSDSGVFFQVVDSIQFRYGDEIVQWPDSLLITEISSFMRVTAGGGDINWAAAFQNLTLTRSSTETDTVTVNGTGNVMGDVSWIGGVTTTDSTSCHASYDLDYTVSGLKFNLYQELQRAIDETRCASEGVVNMAGSFDMNCIGTGAMTVGGEWNIRQTYNHGTIRYVITNGILIWDFTESCP